MKRRCDELASPNRHGHKRSLRLSNVANTMTQHITVSWPAPFDLALDQTPKHRTANHHHKIAVKHSRTISSSSDAVGQSHP